MGGSKAAEKLLSARQLARMTLAVFHVMHQSFVTTASLPPPTYGEGWGIAGQSAGQLLSSFSAGEMMGL